MSEGQAKFALPLCFSSATAQNYFMITYAEQNNPAINFAQFVTSFLENCPMEADDPTTI